MLSEEDVEIYTRAGMDVMCRWRMLHISNGEYPEKVERGGSGGRA